MQDDDFKVGDLVAPKAPTYNLHPDIVYKIVDIFRDYYPVLVDIHDPRTQFVIMPEAIQKINDFKLTVYQSTTK